MDTPDYLLFLFSILIFALGFIAGLLVQRARSKAIGEIEISEDDRGHKQYNLVLNSDPDNLIDYKRVIFTIKSESSS